jgi:hypothetical protein
VLTSLGCVLRRKPSTDFENAVQILDQAYSVTVSSRPQQHLAAATHIPATETLLPPLKEFDAESAGLPNMRRVKIG